MVFFTTDLKGLSNIINQKTENEVIGYRVGLTGTKRAGQFMWWGPSRSLQYDLSRLLEYI